MPVQIEGYDFTLFADRDRANLAHLSFGGRVAWFEHRIRLMLLDPLETLKPHDRGRTADDLWSLLVFGAVLFNGVEALGSFCVPLKSGNRSRFRGFVKLFMNATYHPHEATLWNFRNSLTHGLTIENGAFEFFDHASVRFEHGEVQIDPDSLLRDFTKALESYLGILRLAKPTSSLRTYFEDRFNQRYGVPPCPI